MLPEYPPGAFTGSNTHTWRRYRLWPAPAGFDGQAIIRWHPKFGLMVNGSYFSHFGNRQRLAEAGLGFTELLDRNGSGALSIYLGIGRGDATSISGSHSFMGSPVTSDYRGTFLRYFVQPAASFRQKGLEFSITARTAYLLYSSSDPSGELPIAKKGKWLYEPAFTLKVGSARGTGKIVCQLGLMMGAQEDVVQDPFRFSVGYILKPAPKVRRRINAADFF